MDGENNLTMQNQAPERKKESLPGIIATVLALLTGTVLVVLVLMVTYLETTTPGGVDEQAPLSIFLGFVLFAIIPVSGIGTILGFAGLFQRNRRRTFPVFGAFLNLVLFCSVIGLIVVGLLAS